MTKELFPPQHFMKFMLCVLYFRKCWTREINSSPIFTKDFGLSNQGYCFSSGHICMWELGYEEGWALKNWCFWTVVLERTLGSPLDCREIKPINLREIRPGCSLKDWCWGWNSKALATWCEELTPWKRPWCWERLTAGGDRKDRGWDGWMASQTR